MLAEPLEGLELGSQARAHCLQCELRCFSFELLELAKPLGEEPASSQRECAHRSIVEQAGGHERDGAEPIVARVDVGQLCRESFASLSGDALESLDCL